MLTGKTNIRSNLTRTLLIILGIVLALIMSLNSGLIAFDDVDGAGNPKVKNPFAKTPTETVAPSPVGKLSQNLIRVALEKIRDL